MTEFSAHALFNFPPQAKVGRVLPKSKIYQHGRVSTALRERFVRQVDQITWQYKLAPETINLPAKAGVVEIEIFDITLKTENLDEAVLRAIDRAIPLPIIFQTHHAERTRMVAAYKRPSEAQVGKWVTADYFVGAWQSASAKRQPLPIALDLHSLYEQLLRSLLAHSARPNESLPSHIDRLTQLRSQQNEYRKLESRLHKEKQFNRKVVLNAELRSLGQQIQQLQ
ncbi:MAG: DUF4391 domain-containing protein [Rhodocyclaceae bacterium]|nr:DUF4391 domain-containing protein [Rhodocyclaceae bacterium]